jgi:hypothetical protein
VPIADFAVERAVWLELGGLNIDPVHYLPAEPVPGFPPDVPRLIEKWNRLFGVNYFSCRAALCAIAERNNLSASGVIHIDHSDMSSMQAVRNEAVFFYHDDDDIFDPLIADHFAHLNLEDTDVIVCPLFRFCSELFTFVRSGEATDLLLGRKQDFHFRYQTNNYGLVGARMDDERFVSMKDHVEASAHAEFAGLFDHVLSRPVSATIKTVWSASMLPRLDNGKEPAVSELREFRAVCDHIELPPEYDWLARSLGNFCQFFEFVELSEGEDNLDAVLAEFV